jgi:hypothetical protein
MKAIREFGYSKFENPNSKILFTSSIDLSMFYE